MNNEKKYETLADIYHNSFAFRSAFKHFLRDVKCHNDDNNVFVLMSISRCKGIVLCLYDLGIVDCDLELYAYDVLSRFLRR